jgi:hypothetical protein
MIGVPFLVLLAIGALAQVDPLEKALKDTAEPIQRDILASYFVFPRTASLRHSTDAVSSFEIDELNFNDIVSRVQKDVHLIDMSVRKVPLLLLFTFI